MFVTDKVALITGGASGIGLAITESLLQNNIKGVIIADLNSDLGEKVSEDLRNKYKTKNVIFHLTNVTNKESFRDAFKATFKKFNQLDILINNAGICNDIKYEETLNVNLLGVMHGTTLAIEYMSKSKGGKGGVVMSISSTNALQLIETFPMYSATKIGTMNLMQGFGHAFNYDSMGIRMMALLPGKTVATNIGCDCEAFTNTQQAIAAVWTKPGQMPTAVSAATIHLLKHGESGSCWVIEENKLYLLNFPKFLSFAKLIKEFEENL